MIPIKHVTQSLPDSCVSACLAMILGVDEKKVIEEFHRQYVNEEIYPSDYLKSKGVDVKVHNTQQRSKDLENNRVYMLAVPSLNIECGLHAILACTVTMDNGNTGWVIFDPNQGRCDRRYYTTGIDSFEYSQGIACEVKSWCAELSIDIKDLNRGLV